VITIKEQRNANNTFLLSRTHTSKKLDLRYKARHRTSCPELLEKGVKLKGRASAYPLKCQLQPQAGKAMPHQYGIFQPMLFE
jgi:hypothetical protein